MPGRKSNISTISNGPDESAADNTPAKPTKERDGLSVEDLSLPKSMIARLAKGVLPANTQIQRDALLALHKSATVFVSYIASSSNESAQASGKKTILPQDVITALKDVELEGFLPRLEAELKKYNDIQCDKRNTYRRKIKEEKAAAVGKDGDSTVEDQSATNLETNGAANGHAEGDDAERPAKKFKGENGGTAPPDPDDAGDDDAGDDLDAEEPDDEEADDDVVEDEVEDDEDGTQDETMEDALEEPDAHSDASEDEALDDPDSD